MNTRAWVGLTLTVAFPSAFAQTTEREQPWTGLYIGGSVGTAKTDNDGGEVLFDTMLDGVFGDTVRTLAGANAFSPGFCGGAAVGATPAAGCTGDDDGAEVGFRVGYDWRWGKWVIGGLGEYATYDTRDSVSAYSTTPAFYTMTRDLENTISLRVRAGMAFGNDDRWLAYLTAGTSRARIDSSLTTSNAANAFVEREEGSSTGVQAGIGAERRLRGGVEIGLHYIRTRVDDEDFRVRATPGTAPATNPFLLSNPDGTDFARSDDAVVGGLGASATWRF